MKTLQFGVKCSDFNLMKAFKEECESMGWKYRSDFTKFLPEKFYSYPAMYFTDDWHGKPFGFALTNIGCSIEKVFNLPQDWDAAIEHARECISNTVSFQLNGGYTAKIDYTRETVEVGCQTFSFAIIRELASVVNKKQNK